MDTERREIWAQLLLSRPDEHQIRQFLIAFGVRKETIFSRMHVTIYHARVALEGINAGIEPADVIVSANETRFMVLIAGGESPRPGVLPGDHKVGIRLMRREPARSQILSLRERLVAFESPEALGNRRPSTRSRSAFGAGSFQPHMSLLHPGSSIDLDLTKLGAAFRAHFDSFRFDRFQIDIALPPRRHRTGAETQGNANT